MQIVRNLAKERWRAFVENHPQGQIFHSPEMFQVFARSRGHTPMLFAAVDDNDQPLAILLPVQITLINGVLKQLTTRSVVYGSVLCVPTLTGQEALQFLLKSYKKSVKNGVLFTELRNLSNMTTLQPILEEEGFIYEDHLNYLIDLNRSPEAICQSFGRRLRKKTRKGLRDNDVQIHIISKKSDLPGWYNTLTKTYGRAHVPLVDYSIFEAAFDILQPKGMAKFFLAKIKGASVACSLELPYKDIIYGWYGGSNREYSRYNPNEMLMWYVLEWGATHNYRIYDFGGAGRPDEEYGVRDFKAKFKGNLVGYGRNTHIHAPIKLKLSKLGYAVYRKFL